MSNVIRTEVSVIINRCESKSLDDLIIQNLKQLSHSEGLNEEEMNALVGIITSNKLGSAMVEKLLHCLVPESFVSNSHLKRLLSWFFSHIHSGRISKYLEKQFIKWIMVITEYELADVSVIDMYFHSFLFLMRTAHLEAPVCHLLCLIVKVEDAKRWTVKKILDIKRRSESKAHLNTLLSILKSFRPDVVPENIPITRKTYKSSGFHEHFEKALERKSRRIVSDTAELDKISWNRNESYNKQSGSLTRLIPVPTNVCFEPSTKLRKRSYSIMDIKDMISLGVHYPRIEIPTQTLSLLSNTAGFHVLAYSDSVTKTRFCHKLYHTLFRVFILELEHYSSAEKSMFLDAIVGLQEYIQEGIPVVSEFLLHYLLIWDGDEYQEQILNLLQWVVIKNKEDWQECIFRPLRTIFRSSGSHCKYLIIETMGALLRNILAFQGRTASLFSPNSMNKVEMTVINDLVSFVNELIAEGLIWNREAALRDIMSAGLNFYEICSLIEYSEEFPVVLIMPPSLVYRCLFSGNRVCIARLCKLIVRIWKNTVQKLINFGHIEEYQLQIEKTRIYIMDCYRYLWSSVNFTSSVDSFLFHHKGFCQMLDLFEKYFNMNLGNIFNIQNNYIFWNGDENLNKVTSNTLQQYYPSILHLKTLCEEFLV